MKILTFSLAIFVLCFSSCKKLTSENASQESKIFVAKDHVQWKETRAVSTLNTNNNIIAILVTQGTETFTLTFPKPITTTPQNDFNAYALIVPAIGMASISDSYYLDSSKSNSLHISALDYKTNRVAGKFSLNLKQDEKHVEGEAKSVLYNGEFDVKFNEQAL